MLRHNKGLEERIGRCDSKEDINANDDCTCIGGLEWHQGAKHKKEDKLDRSEWVTGAVASARTALD